MKCFKIIHPHPVYKGIDYNAAHAFTQEDKAGQRGTILLNVKHLGIMPDTELSFLPNEVIEIKP